MEPQNQTPIAPAQQPTSAQPHQTEQTPSPQPKKRSILPKILLIAGVLLLIVGGTAGGYVLGKRAVKPAPALVPAQAEITIPEGATVTAECIDGLGKQYVLPKDIPFGPIYNVHDGKVTSVEYMVGADEITKDPARFMDLEGFKYPFNHVTIDYLPSGHAGNIGGHFHVDLFMISKEEAAGIKCGSENADHTH